ncbi:MAG: hypothetical protein K6T31_02055 [Alicyclobacillus sp.]|nr:hypothetical protein [Alicyclobacillus sp.]
MLAESAADWTHYLYAFCDGGGLMAANHRRFRVALCAGLWGGFGLGLAGMLAGCNLQPGQRAAALSAAPSAAVQEQLPSTIAGPPQTLSVQPQPLPPVIMAYRTGQRVNLSSRMRWHGRVVNIYYLPAFNVVHSGDHYELRSARQVQWVARAEIRPDGQWQTVWNTGSYVIPRHDPFFLLAQDDKGEVGMIQLNTFN